MMEKEKYHTQQSGFNIHGKLKEMFGMDIRSLALYRIGLSIATIGDLIERAIDLRAHYSDEGIFPRHTLFESYANNYTFIVHAMSGHPNFQALCFLIHGICALCMLAGYRTRTFTILTWFMLCSLQARNPFVNHGGDLYFRLIFFFAMFLPLGGCFSVDNALSNVQHKTNRNPRVLTGGTISALGQIMVMYIISTYHKSGSEWLVDYTSTWYAIQLDYYKTSIALFLDPFHDTLRLLTYLVMKWEFFGNFCFCMPIYTDYFRVLAVLGYWAMHFGFILCIRLGFFFWVCFVAMLPLIPTLIWDKINALPTMRAYTQKTQALRIRASPASSIAWHAVRIACEFCCVPRACVTFFPAQLLRNEKKNNFAGDFLVKEMRDDRDVGREREREFREVAAGEKLKESGGEEGERGVEMSVYVEEEQGVSADTWLEVEANGKVTKNFAGLETIYKNSRAYPITYPIRAIYNFCAKILRKPLAYVYSRVSKYVVDFVDRKNATSNFTPPPPQIHKKKRVRLGDLFTIACLFYAISWNFSNLGLSTHLPYTTNWFGLITHLDQFWGMFSPHPPKAHWYYVIEAERDDGVKFELFKNEALFTWEANIPFTWDKPKPFHKSFKNHRWYKFFEMGFNGDKHDNVRLGFGRFICREYNAVHFGKDRLQNYKVWFLVEYQPLYGERSAPSKQVLWEHICYFRDEKE